MFYERLKKICAEKEVSVTAMCDELGLSSGNLSKWKNGSTPGAKIIRKIAEYLNISVDYLLGNTEKKEISSETELTEAQRELLRAFSALSEEKQALILDFIKKL